MIPMRAVENILVFECRVAAGNLRDNVRRVDPAHLISDLKGSLRIQSNGMKAGLRGGIMERSEILTCGGEKIVSTIGRNKSLGLDSLSIVTAAQHHVFTPVVLKQICTCCAR